MPTFDIVCLANSRKRHGRCVAGLRLDGKGWLRPVGSNPDGVLHPHHYMLPDDTEPQWGDVLRVHCSRSKPQPHHPEDWAVMSLPWERVSGAAENNRQEWLRSYLSAGPHLLDGADDRISAAHLQNHPASHSLALVAPESLKWHITANKAGERRTRVIFDLDGAEYNLSLTDPVWEQRLMRLKTGVHPRHAAQIEADAEVWLTISLGEPFAKSDGDTEFCYKLVAGVLVLTTAGLAQTQTAGGSESQKRKTALSGRSKPMPALMSAYISAPDLAAVYPDPFADDLPAATIPEGHPTVKAAIISASMPPAVTANVEAAVIPALPANAPTRKRKPTRQHSPQQNNPNRSADNDAIPTTYGRTNGKWDNPQDKLLWQKQIARNRYTIAVPPPLWSPDEDALLQRLAADSETPEAIAAQIGRPLEDVYSRMEELNSGLDKQT